MSEQPKVEQKLVDFNNPLVKSLLAQNLKVDEDKLKYFVLPAEGDTITLGNVIYKIRYVRANPFRFSAEPIGILKDAEMERLLTEQQGNGQAPLPNQENKAS